MVQAVAEQNDERRQQAERHEDRRRREQRRRRRALPRRRSTTGAPVSAWSVMQSARSPGDQPLNDLFHHS